MVPKRFRREGGMGDRSCVAIIQDNFVLMVHQSYKGETFWTFPGGKIEIGEQPMDCGIREVKEETRLDIRITNKVCELYSQKINGTYHCYLGEITAGKAELGYDPELPNDSQELHELRWFPLKQKENHPEVKRVLAFLKK
jgi:8-oxo-dGTP diphosphatase